MTFFDDSFMKKNEENKDNELLNDLEEEQIPSNNSEIDINRKNREEYEGLMKDSQSKKDMYYDKNNIFVKLVLFLLLVFIILGSAYYILQYLGK